MIVLPLDLLEKSLNRKVSLLLKDGRLLEGKLTGYDQYMNLVLEDTMEKERKNQRRLDKVVVRGSNVVSISFT
jgi:small nuclear ribonucleoprotein